MKLKHVKLVRKAIVIGVLVALIAIFSLLRLNENVSEYFFARGLSRGYVAVVATMTDIFPFSIFGLFVLFGILALIACIVVFFVYLKKKKRTEAVALAERVVIAALTVAFIYIATAGGCYNRKELPLKGYEGEQLTAEETAEIVGAFLDDFNEIADSLSYTEEGKSICPYTYKELQDLLIEEYKRLPKEYYSAYTPRFKKGIFSSIMSYEGISGITFQPTGEGVINGEVPSCYALVAAAHELAHTKGVMRERDANLTAYYLLFTAKTPYFRYCGYMYSLKFLISLLALQDERLYYETMKKYPAKAIVDKKLEVEFWESKEGFIETVGEFLNNVYLKLSGVKEGTENYADPSSYTVVPQVVDNQEVQVVKVTYSDTARIVIGIGQKRLQEQKEKGEK